MDDRVQIACNLSVDPRAVKWVISEIIGSTHHWNGQSRSDAVCAVLTRDLVQAASKSSSLKLMLSGLVEHLQRWTPAADYPSEKSSPTLPTSRSSTKQSQITPAEIQMMVMKTVEGFAVSEDESNSIESRLEDLGLDSLAMVDFRNQLCSSVGHFVDTEILLANPSLGEIVADLVRQEAAVSETDRGIPDASARDAFVGLSSLELGLRQPNSLHDKRMHQKIIFVLSTPRAGSSLLQLCLQAHPQLYAPQELYLLPFATMRERAETLPQGGFREGLIHAVAELLQTSYEAAATKVESWGRLSTVEVYQKLQDMCAPRILVDKTPANAMHSNTMRRASRVFSNAKFIHIIRHPASCLKSWVELDRNSRALQGQPTKHEEEAWAELEEKWTSINANISDFVRFQTDATASRSLKYEDLVCAPEAQLDLVCDVLGVARDKQMACPYETAAVESFKGHGERRRSIASTDPKLLKRSAIDPGQAHGWKTVTVPRPFGALTRMVGQQHGYEFRSEMIRLDAKSSDETLKASDEEKKIVTDSLVKLYNAVKASKDLIYCLQQGQPGAAPVVILHAGNGLPYGSQLLRHLDKQQPVYCTIGPELVAEVFETYADEVSALGSRLRGQFGDTLVHFVGYSFGAVHAAALCGAYQRLGLAYTITLLDPLPCLVMTPEVNRVRKSALHRRAHCFDNQLDSDLRTKVESKEITETWQLDAEMLRLVRGDVNLGNMMRATATYMMAVSQHKEHVLEGAYEFETLDTRTTVFVLESGVEWFKHKNAGNFKFDDSMLKDETYGWASLFTGGATRIDVKGSHLEFFMHRENVVEVAKHLRKLIESDHTQAAAGKTAASEKVRFV